MFLLYEYDIFWAFFIISSVIPILAFRFSGLRLAKDQRNFLVK